MVGHLTFFKFIAMLFSGITVMVCPLIVFCFKWKNGPVMWILKSIVSALVPLLLIAAITGVIIGAITRFYLPIIIGGCSALVFISYLFRISSASNSSTPFENAFGKYWEQQIPIERRKKFLRKPTGISLPRANDFIFQQNISFSEIPSTKLFCDLWLPSKNIKNSGLAFIYLHGGAWCMLDKDFGTRPFFQHLASQGHVIMDIGYRFFRKRI
jgi:hypothetical protein